MMDSDRPMWKPYTVRHTDLHEYETVKYGVREEYPDGATRFIHNETVDTMEEAGQLAAKFNLNVRKGKHYDNTMKRWD